MNGSNSSSATCHDQSEKIRRFTNIRKGGSSLNPVQFFIFRRKYPASRWVRRLARDLFRGFRTLQMNPEQIGAEQK